MRSQHRSRAAATPTENGIGLPPAVVVLRSFLWLFVDKVLRFILGIVVGAWVARTLGPAVLGELSYAIAICAMFQSACKLGLDAIVVREIASCQSDPGQVLGTTVRLQALAGIVGVACATLCVWALRPGDIDALVLVAIVSLSLVFQAGDTIDLWFQAHTRSRVPVIAKALAYLISNLLKVVAIMSDAPVPAFALIVAIDAALSLAFLVFAYRRHGVPLQWRWSAEIARKLLGESWYFLVSSVAIGIYMRIDQVMVREIAGDEALGIYAAAVPLSDAWAFLPVIVMASVAPTLARLRTENFGAYERLMQRLFCLSAVLSVSIAIVVSVLSPWLIMLLYGTAYAQSSLVLTIHVFTLIPVFLGTVQSQWIVQERVPHIALYKALLGALACVVLNLVLIPEYGAPGAAVASCLAYLLSAILSNVILSPAIFKMQMRALFVPWSGLRAR